MKFVSAGLALLFLTSLTGFAAPPVPAAPAKNVRTVANLPGFPRETLKRIVSPKFYRSLLVSPVEGWVVVRGQLAGGRFAGARVTHSELGGAYDDLAMTLAKGFGITGFGHTDRQAPTTAVQMHLVIYQIADGKMVLGFPVSDEAGGNQLNYYGSAFLAVQGKDGKRTEIKGPEMRRR